MTKNSKLAQLIALDDFTEKVNAQLKQLIAENPDFQYSPGTSICSYNSGPRTAGGEPIEGYKSDGCIFGQAFQRLGIPKSELSIRASIVNLLADFNENCPENWLKIQRRQDTGDRWADFAHLV